MWVSLGHKCQIHHSGDVRADTTVWISDGRNKTWIRESESRPVWRAWVIWLPKVGVAWSGQAFRRLHTWPHLHQGAPLHHLLHHGAPYTTTMVHKW